MANLRAADIREIPIGSIKPAKYNPRRKLRQGDKEYKDIAASLDAFGLVQPLIWNERTGNLVGGHQRLQIIRNERPEQTHIQVAVVDLDLIEEKRLNIILNRQGEGLWSAAKLADLITELAGENAAIHSLGFTEEEIEGMIKTKPDPEQDPDIAPAPPKKPKLATGDVIDFFDATDDATHRLVVGDCTDKENWNHLFAGRRPASLIFTDPPSGVDYKSQSKSGKMARKDLENDSLRALALEHLIRDSIRAATDHVEPTAAAYVFYASKTHRQFEAGIEAAEWEVKQQLIWTKQMALGRADFHWAHEPILYCQRIGQRCSYYGNRCETTTWEEMSVEELRKAIRTEAGTVWSEKRDPPSSYIHPTQKPTSLARKALGLSTLYGQTVVDMFAGSGSTLIAAELEARTALVMEDEPGFAESIVMRFAQTFPGRRITRNGEDLTFHHTTYEILNR